MLLFVPFGAAEGDLTRILLSLNYHNSFCVVCVFFIESGSTQLSGLFVEKPPSSVVAVAGQARTRMDA